jgi:predicted nuclease of predicted toxin-antitoxin system
VRIRLYFDEDSMHRSLVRALRARGVDVVTALDAGMIERADAEHLDYATGQGRVLCSFNVGDFYRLHTDYLSQGRPHAGIILMRQQYYSVGEQMRRLLRLIASKPADEMENWVEFLSAWG